MIETFPNQFPDRDYEIAITCPEFTCISPATGGPTFAEIRITYVPNHACIELKALKLYLHGYRHQRASNESAVRTILGDLVDACHPRRMEVVGAFKSGDGAGTLITATHPQVG